MTATLKETKKTRCNNCHIKATDASLQLPPKTDNASLQLHLFPLK